MKTFNSIAVIILVSCLLFSAIGTWYYIHQYLENVKNQEEITKQYLEINKKQLVHNYKKWHRDDPTLTPEQKRVANEVTLFLYGKTCEEIIIEEEMEK